MSSSDNQTVVDQNHIPKGFDKTQPVVMSPIGTQLADLLGYTFVENATGFIPVPEYRSEHRFSYLAEYGDSAEIIPCGMERLLPFDFQAQGCLILEVPVVAYGENPKRAEDYLNNTFQMIYAETRNAEVCRMLLKERTVHSVESSTVLSVANKKLCAKAKQNCMMITNSSGFASLDVRVDGAPLIKKTQAGYVFDEKYPLLVVDDTELSPFEDGCNPIIMGDVANAATVLRYGEIEQDDSTYTTMLRRWTVYENPFSYVRDEDCYIVCGIL